MAGNIPTTFSSWSATPASNQPDSTDTSTVQADLQNIQAAIRTIFPNVDAALTPTHTELNYVDGVTSAIQTQLNAKADLAGATFTGAIETKRATVAATATTTPLWTIANGNVQDWTSSPTITDFPNAPQAGSQRIVYPAAGTIITHAGNIIVQGNASYTAAAGDELTITAITTTTFYVTIQRKDGLSVVSHVSSRIQPITASVSANALTVTLNPTSLDFRSATLGSGTVNTRTISAPISTVISSGSTGGTVNAQQSRLAILAIDNAGTGTQVLGWTNVSGGLNLDETNLITTTAEGGAGGADSANIIYTTIAVTTPSPYRVVGYIESTQATAGTWATAPSTIQGYGGQALVAMSSLGYGQTWKDVTGSRSASTTYYNTTGKPIEVSFEYGGAIGTPTITISGVAWNMSTTASAGAVGNATFIIPNGESYLFTPQGACTVTQWLELR